MGIEDHHSSHHDGPRQRRVYYNTIIVNRTPKQLGVCLIHGNNGPIAEKAMNSDVPADRAFALLKTKLRRQVVTLLLEVDGTWDVEALAAELVRLDPTVAPDGTGVEAHTERLVTRLYHCTLPKLADSNVVDFDHEEMTIAPGQHLPIVGSYLDETLGIAITVTTESATSASAD